MSPRVRSRLLVVLSCTYTPFRHHRWVGFCLDASLLSQLPESACVVETTCLLVFETLTSFNLDSYLEI